MLWTMIFIQGAVFRPRHQAIVRHPAMNVTQLLELEGLTMKLFYCETRKGSQKKNLHSNQNNSHLAATRTCKSRVFFCVMR